jgi:hypothetical protein
MPKMTPGQCRILKEKLPDSIKRLMDEKNPQLKMISTKKYDVGHYHFYWSFDDPNFISSFESRYKAISNMKSNLKYNMMLDLLIESSSWPTME